MARRPISRSVIVPARPPMERLSSPNGRISPVIFSKALALRVIDLAAAAGLITNWEIPEVRRQIKASSLLDFVSDSDREATLADLETLHPQTGRTKELNRVEDIFRESWVKNYHDPQEGWSWIN